MLVLSRKTGERIQIGDDITVEIRRISGSRVALAFEAPHHVRILRGELEVFHDGFDCEEVGSPVAEKAARDRKMLSQHIFLT